LATYGSPRWKTWLMADPPRAMVSRFLKRLTGSRARVDYLACYDMNHNSQRDRERFVERVSRQLQGLARGGH
jgi:hypothetical protein